MRTLEITFNGDTTFPADLMFTNFVKAETEGLGAFLSNVEGWDETPTITRVAVDKIRGHGQWVSKIARVARREVRITVAVHDTTMNLRDLRETLGRLIEASDINVRVTTSIGEDIYTEYCQGGYIESATPLYNRIDNWLTVTIPVVFPDPYIYGTKDDPDNPGESLSTKRL